MLEEGKKGIDLMILKGFITSLFVLKLVPSWSPNNKDLQILIKFLTLLMTPTFNLC